MNVIEITGSDAVSCTLDEDMGVYNKHDVIDHRYGGMVFPFGVEEGNGRTK